MILPHPFGETKNLIAGCLEIDVETYERALELAGEPVHKWLEVRPFLAALQPSRTDARLYSRGLTSRARPVHPAA